ncbi:TPA: hypothetical protein DCQ44_00080 [Candidatus Taylorbacteria bacterium]|nr:hypothetical protein [Candidatus Taylorbacteria bacterium]
MPEIKCTPRCGDAAPLNVAMPQGDTLSRSKSEQELRIEAFLKKFPFLKRYGFTKYEVQRVDEKLLRQHIRSKRFGIDIFSENGKKIGVVAETSFWDFRNWFLPRRETVLDAIDRLRPRYTRKKLEPTFIIVFEVENDDDCLLTLYKPPVLMSIDQLAQTVRSRLTMSADQKQARINDEVDEEIDRN